MSPASVVDSLRDHHAQVSVQDARDPQKALASLRIRDLAGDIVVRFREQRSFLLQLRSEKGEPFADIAYDPYKKDAELGVNTTRGAFDASEPITLRILLDGSVLEVFANDRTAITARVYSVPSAPLLLEVSGANSIERLHAWQMKPISGDRLSRSPG